MEQAKIKLLRPLTEKINARIKEMRISEQNKKIILSAVSFKKSQSPQTRANFTQAFKSIKKFGWTYNGRVTGDGKLVGDGGISCLGFVEYITNAINGGNTSGTFAENIRAQADLLTGKNNDCPYPILTDIHSSVNQQKLLNYLSSTGEYFAVQTYSPRASKSALHAAIIFVDNSPGKPKLMVAESTSIGGAKGPSIKTYEKWAVKENKQSSGKGVNYSFNLIDPKKNPQSFSLSPMGSNPIQRSKPASVIVASN